MNTPTPPLGVIAEKAIFLSGNVPSAKNNKEIGFYFKKAGEHSNWGFLKDGKFKPITPTLRSSERTENYIKDIVQQVIDNKARFKQLVKDFPKPYVIQLFFVRKSRIKFDFGNAVETISDTISGSYWKKHPKIPQIVTQWIDVDDVENVVFIPVLANMLAGKQLYTVDKLNPGVWIMPLDIRTPQYRFGMIMGDGGIEWAKPHFQETTSMAEIPFPNPNAKFVEELRAMDKCLLCSEPLTKNDGEYCQECKTAF